MGFYKQYSPYFVYKRIENDKCAYDIMLCDTPYILHYLVSDY